MSKVALNSDEIVVQTAVRPYHRWTDEELKDVWISSVSRWHDHSWYFDNMTEGSLISASSMYWSFRLSDGSLMTDPKNQQALGYWKRLAWSLYAENAKGTPLKPGTFGSISTGIRRFVPWMMENDYTGPHELDSQAMTRLVCDVPKLALDGEDGETDEEDEGLTWTVIYTILRIPEVIWRQRRAMQKAGFAPMPECPYHPSSASAISYGCATKADGWIKPLPNEVAIPILNKAAWFVGEPAEDVIRLMDACQLAWQDASRKLKSSDRGVSNYIRNKVQNLIAKKFIFSTLDGEQEPWFKYASGDVIREVRYLEDTIRDACVITIQSQTGVRISEICGMTAGTNPVTGWPLSVRVEPSLTGLNEIFLLRTNLSKTEKTPRFLDWVIGMRPRGSNEIPLAIQAMRVLERIYAPTRSRAKNTYLLARLGPGKGLRKNNTSTSTIESRSLILGMKTFVERWVDLSGLPDDSRDKTEDNDLFIWKETKGRCISSHMLRKSWAQFAINVDPRLLPIVSMQFKHLSLAMTETGYISNNRHQVEALDSIRSYQTAQLMYELARGTSRVAGKRGEEIEANISELRERIKRHSTAQAWQQAVRYCEINDLKIFFSPHGGCVPRTPLTMQCHKVAGTESWRNKEPNYATRTPQLCAGCDCFMVNRRNEPFWSDRYVECAVSYHQGEQMGMAGQFTVIRSRRNQAKKILIRIGANMQPLDQRIATRTMEQKHATT